VKYFPHSRRDDHLFIFICDGEMIQYKDRAELDGSQLKIQNPSINIRKIQNSRNSRNFKKVKLENTKVN
jgi:thymidine kinase